MLYNSSMIDEQSKAIGILGGSFAPPHNAHVEMATMAISELALGKVVFVPTTLYYYKTSIRLDWQTRLDMLKLAIKPYPDMVIDTIEAEYNNDLYAILMLEQLQRKYGEIIYIIGGDSLLNIEFWYNAEELLKKYKIAVLTRGASRQQIIDKAKNLKAKYNADITVLEGMPSNISSSLVMNMVILGIDISGLVNNDVKNYIISHNLFSEEMSFVNRVREELGERLYNHCSRVVLKALEINSIIGVPNKKILYAGLLHDIAKNRKDLSLYDSYVPDSLKNSAVAHGFLGAGIAELEYGIDDIEILDAIRYHSTARPAMSKLEQLIFIADMVEENRTYEQVETLRKQAGISLENGIIACTKHKMDYYKENIIASTIDAYNYYANKQLKETL